MNGDELRFEVRHKNLPDIPMENGMCRMTSDGVVAEAKPLPCSTLRVIAARRARQ